MRRQAVYPRTKDSCILNDSFDCGSYTDGHAVSFMPSCSDGPNVTSETLKAVPQQRRIDTSHSHSSSGSSFDYRKLPLGDRDFDDSQFTAVPTRGVPWRAIFLAAVLSVFGFMFLALGTLLLTGYIDSKYSDRTWPLMIVGALMFIPGFYHVRIAYMAYCGERGYSFDDIPDFD